MTRTLLILIVFMFGGITHFNWAQDSSDLLDIYELKISNEESVYSPNWIKGSDEIGEIIVVTSEKEEKVKLPRKFKKNQSGLIFNLQKIKFSPYPPYEILSKELLGSEINTSFQEGPSTYWPDNDTFYFTRSSNKITKDQKLHLKIYSSSLEKNSISSPKEVDLSSSLHNVMHPAIDQENSILYFSSNQGENEDYDLYFCKIDSIGNYLTVNKLLNVNSSSNEAFPFIYRDLLFFASNREGGLGGYDIYYSKFENNQFSAPTLLPSPINTKFDDFSFSITDSLQLGFFSSNREKDSIDISYVFKMNPLKGTKDDYNYLSFSNMVEEKVSVLLNDDIGNNVFPFIGTPIAIIDKKTLHGSINLKSNGSFTYSSENPKKLNDQFTYRIKDGYRISKPISVNLVSADTDYIFRPIFYDFSKYNVIDRYKPRLDSIADLMIQNKNIKVIISSKTDSRGTFKENQKLSENRSKSIFTYLTKDKRIDKKRFQFRDNGESHISGNNSSDYLIELDRGNDKKLFEKKIKDLKEFSPFIYENNDGAFSIIIKEFDKKRRAKSFLEKLKKKGISAKIIINKFIDVSEEEHQKNRRTDFQISSY